MVDVTPQDVPKAVQSLRGHLTFILKKDPGAVLTSEHVGFFNFILGHAKAISADRRVQRTGPLAPEGNHPAAEILRVVDELAAALGG